MIKFFLTGIAAMSLSYLSAQTFNYNFSQSTGSYQPLAGGSVLANSGTWNAGGYKIPIGFSFAFMEKNFDTLTITSNGFILFGDDNKRAIATFKGIIPVTDSANNTSSISYSLANNILKIEYKNVGFGITSPDNFNFQVWLDKSGNKIEFHTGGTNLSAAPDSLVMPIAGILNPSMDKTTNGYLLTGNPSQATQANAETLGVGDLKYMIRVPEPNTVYILTPQ